MRTLKSLARQAALPPSRVRMNGAFEAFTASGGLCVPRAPFEAVAKDVWDALQEALPGMVDRFVEAFEVPGAAGRDEVLEKVRAHAGRRLSGDELADALVAHLEASAGGLESVHEFMRTADACMREAVTEAMGGMFGARALGAAARPREA